MPAGFAMATDHLFVGSAGANTLKISQNGIITRIAGTGKAGYSGDGGSALNAQLNTPEGIAVDETGNIFVADMGNNAIRLLRAQPGPYPTVTAILTEPETP